MNFQMFKLDLEKAEEPEIKLPASAGSSKIEEMMSIDEDVQKRKPSNTVAFSSVQSLSRLKLFATP